MNTPKIYDQFMRSEDLFGPYKDHEGIEEEHEDKLGILLLVELFTGLESIHSNNITFI